MWSPVTKSDYIPRGGSTQKMHPYTSALLVPAVYTCTPLSTLPPANLALLLWCLLHGLFTKGRGAIQNNVVTV